MNPPKYKNPSQPPPTFNVTPETIQKDIQTVCASSRFFLDKLVSDITPESATFDNVLRPIAWDDGQAAQAVRVLTFYRKVSTDAAVRKAAAEATKYRSKHNIEASMREDVFKLVEAVYNKEEELDPESRKFLDEQRNMFLRNGLTLPAGPRRDEFKQIKERISELCTEFAKNVDEETGSLWCTLDQLSGLPGDIIEGLEGGVGEHEGQLKVTHKINVANQVMQHCRDAETRRKYMVSRANRCNQNIPIFREVIRLRAKAAKLLGYESHAAFRMEQKMAKSPERVMEFLNDVKHRATQFVGLEVEKLIELKKADLQSRSLPFDGNLYLWDTAYYTRLLKEHEFSIDQLKIAEYFPILPALTAMLRLFGQLFGMVFIEVKYEADRANISPTGRAEDIVWHEDVILFSVWNEDGEGGGFLGYLYLDLFPRPGKYGHACHNCLQPGFTLPDGSRSYPVAAILANFTKPTKTKPSLLKHSEAKTLFHEIGHGIHNLSARTQYSEFHGTAVSRDFVEAPSKMLENWCWTTTGLKTLSSHYKTGEPLPDGMIAGLVKSKHANVARATLGSVKYSLFDMTIHTASVDDEIDFAKLYNTDLSGIKGPEALGEGSDWGHGYASGTHLMGGYDAGYYSYLWCNVYSVDMYSSAFKKDPLARDQGRRYRHMVLEKGASQEETLTLTQFLGREPNSNAFFEEVGWVKQIESSF